MKNLAVAYPTLDTGSRGTEAAGGTAPLLERKGPNRAR